MCVAPIREPRVGLWTPPAWGSSKDAKAHRGQQKELIDAGKSKEAQDMDISDAHSKFGDKYDVQIQEMKEYTDRQGY
jgi:hypothetical protein